MKTIVFIGTQKSGSSREAIRAAERLGYYTVLLTDRPSFLEKRTEFPDVHFMQQCDLNNIEELKNAIRQLLLKALNVCAVVSFVDPYCYIACLLAEEFGVNHFSTEAMGIMEDKILSRKALKDTPFIPRYMELSEKDSLSKDVISEILPVVVKSPLSAGSKDVFKANSYKDFIRCREKLMEKHPGTPVLVEEFLDGPQYLVETVVYGGTVHIVAIIEQEITFNHRFIVTGYNLIIDPPAILYDSIKGAAEFIINKHGLESGPCHLEMRYVKGQWKLIETNPRISGAGMNRMLEIGFGFSLVEETLKLAVGSEPNLEPRYKKPVFAQYVTLSESGILEKVTGKGKASRSPGVEAVYVKPKKGSKLTPPLSMGDRYAYVMATGTHGQEAKANAKFAASQIYFWLTSSTVKEDVKRALEKQTEVESPLLKYLEKFKLYLGNRPVNENTASAYILLVFEYLNWFKNNFGRECTCLKKEDITAYKNYLFGLEVISPKIITQIFNALVGFNEFLVDEKLQVQIVISKDDLL